MSASSIAPLGPTSDSFKTINLAPPWRVAGAALSNSAAARKLVRVVRGRVFDVAVDLRRSSATFGRWVGIELSEENHRQLWLPPGFAHGYLVLSESADFLYKTTDYYAPEHERCLIWNDPEIGIDWPLDREPILSAKDQLGLPFSKVEVFA